MENNKIKIKAEYMSLDYESDDVYFIIVEILESSPLRAYCVKLPKPYTLFPFNVYIRN